MLLLASSLAAAASDFGAIVDIVNTANATWVAGPVDRSIETFKSMCGTWLPGHPKYV